MNVKTQPQYERFDETLRASAKPPHLEARGLTVRRIDLICGAS
jgi:hypothetical protein